MKVMGLIYTGVGIIVALTSVILDYVRGESKLLFFLWIGVAIAIYGLVSTFILGKKDDFSMTSITKESINERLRKKHQQGNSVNSQYSQNNSYGAANSYMNNSNNKVNNNVNNSIKTNLHNPAMANILSCPNCDKPIRKTQNYCHNCGKQLFIF